MKAKWAFLLVLPLLFGACAEAPDYVAAKKEAIRLRDPIVLVHGASMGGASLKLGPVRLGEYFQFLPAFLEAHGNEVGVPHLSSDAPVSERAMILKNYLVSRFAGRKVHIIAHSLGGLDARFLVSVLRSQQVLSITTIATPHRGTPLADWAFREREQKGFWYWVLRLGGYDLQYRHFLPEVRTAAMVEFFNPRVQDMQGVAYFSVQGYGLWEDLSLSPLLWIPYLFLRGEDHPLSQEENDGLVPVSSQLWGELLVKAKLDHLGQINHHTLRPWRGDASLDLYRMILKNLAAKGF